MRILTSYGKFDYSDLDDVELSKEAREYILNQKNAAEIFFSNEIDLRNIDDEDDLAAIQEIAIIGIAENKFSEPARAIALAEFTDSEIDEVDEDAATLFSVGKAEYYVLTEDEADEIAFERAKDFLNDVGIDGLSDGFKQTVYSEFVETQWFDDAMSESNETYAHDIKNDQADTDDYVSRLHEEMVQLGVMDEPEWPDEESFIDEVAPYEGPEFDVPEPDPDDFETTEAYIDAEKSWSKQEREFEKEQDRLEEEWNDAALEKAHDLYQEARDAYESDLQDEVERNIGDFVEKKNDEYDNGLDYFTQNFGKEEVAEIVNKHNLVDFDAVAQHMVDSDGRGPSISSYDGEEHDVMVVYRKEKFNFYIYRVN